MTQDTLSILKNLVSFKSITPESAGSIEYIAGFLSELGFKCEIKKFGLGKEEVTNLYAIFGTRKPNICFAGHVDVVPPGPYDLWDTDPFNLRIQDDFIYGRGAVDMKGAIACYLSAVKAFLSANNSPKGSISFLITSDEECDGTYGTVKMLDYIKDYEPQIDFCILGEPTSKNKIGDTIKIGRRGSVNFDLKIKGKQGHVAYPEEAINPMNILSNILNELTTKTFDSGTEYFMASNLEITSIDTNNPVTNVIPEEVNVKFNVRFNNNYTAKNLFTEIDRIIATHAKNYDLQYSGTSEPFIQKYSDNMQKFARIVKETCNITPDIETGGGTSDARFIYKYAQVVEFGLNCESAHKINEYTKNSDLQLLHNVYYNCLIEFL